jgi:Mrp family chromosome partitioning ATPase
MSTGWSRDDARGLHPHDEPDLLRDQFRQLLRYRLLLTTGLLLGLLGGGWLGIAGGDSYTAATEVTLRSPSADPLTGGTSGSDLSMGSERRTALSKVVAQQAAKKVHWHGDPMKLAKNLQVTNPPDTVVLRFAYTADDAKAAADRADAFAGAYLANRQHDTERLIGHMITAYKRQLKPLVAERDRLADEIDKMPKGRPLDAALSSRTSLVSRIAQIDSDMNKLQALDTTPGQVVSQATPPDQPSGPGLPLLLALGAAVGIGLGMLAAWGRLVFDPTVRSSGDVVRALRAPVLGTLPRTRRGESEGLLAEGRLAEEYRSVAFRLAYDETFAQRRRLLVVAPRGGIVTTVAAAVNLSAAFAEMGKDVLLVEADLRTPTLTERLHQADGVRPGWARAPQRGTAGWPTGRRVPIDAGESGIFDLVPGHRVRNVPRALTSPAATQLIAHSDERNAVVVVLAPAVLSYADAIALTDRVDGVLVVCDPREVRRDDLARVRELVVGAGGVLLGAVLHSQGTAEPAHKGGARRAADHGRPRSPAPQRAGGTGRDDGEDASGREVGVDTIGLRIVDPSDFEEHSPYR